MLHAAASTCVSICVWPPETGNHIPPHLMNFFQMPSVLLQAEWNFAARVKGHLKADGQAGTFSSTASPPSPSCPGSQVYILVHRNVDQEEMHHL